MHLDGYVVAIDCYNHAGDTPDHVVVYISTSMRWTKDGLDVVPTGRQVATLIAMLTKAMMSNGFSVEWA